MKHTDTLPGGGYDANYSALSIYQKIWGCYDAVRDDAEKVALVHRRYVTRIIASWDCPHRDGIYECRKSSLWQNWGPVTILGFRTTGMGNSMLKLRRPLGSLNFNMGLSIPVGRYPNIVTPPRVLILYKDVVLAFSVWLTPSWRKGSPQEVFNKELY